VKTRRDFLRGLGLALSAPMLARWLDAPPAEPPLELEALGRRLEGLCDPARSPFLTSFVFTRAKEDLQHGGAAMLHDVPFRFRILGELSRVHTLRGSSLPLRELLPQLDPIGPPIPARAVTFEEGCLDAADFSFAGCGRAVVGFLTTWGKVERPFSWHGSGGFPFYGDPAMSVTVQLPAEGLVRIEEPWRRWSS
jgi:hypothetical protein